MGGNQGASAPGKCQVIGRRYLRLLDESLQQGDATCANGEEYPCDPPIQMRTQFPKPWFEFPHHGHSDRPAVLNRFQVRADDALVGLGEHSEPVANGFGPGFGPKKGDIHYGFRLHPAEHASLRRDAFR